MNIQKKIYLIITLLIIAVAAAASYVFFFRPQARYVEFNQSELVSRPAIDLEFSFVAGPDALSLVEAPVEGEPLKGAFILMSSSDYIEVHNNTATETPASISIFVFTLPEQENQDLSKTDLLREWAMDNQSLTGINVSEGEPEEIELDGVKGIKYNTVGAYNQEVQLFNHRGRAYMFVGQYDDTTEDLRDDFEELMQTVVFQ